jgi:hypothetical protein
VNVQFSAFGQLLAEFVKSCIPDSRIGKVYGFERLFVLLVVFAHHYAHNTVGTPFECRDLDACRQILADGKQQD